MMKKSLVLALVLSALLLVTVMAVSVSADASLTIGEVTFVKDTTNNLVTFTVPYTAVEVDQITVIAVKGTAAEAPAPTEANIVYFNQQSSASNSFTFSVPYDAFSADAPYCWIKVGGTAIATASSDGGQEIWASAAPVLVYGDVDGDGSVSAADFTLVVKYALATSTHSALDESVFPGGNFPGGSVDAADVDGDGDVSAADATLIAKFALAVSTHSTPDESTFPGGKFPVEAN